MILQRKCVAVQCFEKEDQHSHKSFEKMRTQTASPFVISLTLLRVPLRPALCDV